jgi:hypothetical protein
MSAVIQSKNPLENPGFDRVADKVWREQAIEQETGPKRTDRYRGLGRPLRGGQAPSAIPTSAIRTWPAKAWSWVMASGMDGAKAAAATMHPRRTEAADTESGAEAHGHPACAA